MATLKCDDLDEEGGLADGSIRRCGSIVLSECHDARSLLDLLSAFATLEHRYLAMSGVV